MILEQGINQLKLHSPEFINGQVVRRGESREIFPTGEIEAHLLQVNFLLLTYIFNYDPLITGDFSPSSLIVIHNNTYDALYIVCLK